MSTPRSRPHSITSDTTETSESETVIYGRNVTLRSGSQSVDNLRSLALVTENSQNARKKLPVSQKSATMDLHSLMLEKFVRDKVQRSSLLSEKLSRINEKVDNILVSLVTIASTRESEKVQQYIQDKEKVTCLMYSLACRLAKTENILETFSSGSSSTQLERRRDKLKSQLEEAKYLNTLVENRAQKVLLILQKYFGDLIVSDFKESVQMKLKIIVELKELNDQVCLSKV